MAAGRVLGVLNGPNLARLPRSSSQDYGPDSWSDIERRLLARGQQRGWELRTFQSNIEGVMIDMIIEQEFHVQGWVINPGAYMISGYALADAIEDSARPFVEVHMSRIFQRESKRHVSQTAPYCRGQVIGFGSMSYDLALEALMSIVDGGPLP